MQQALKTREGSREVTSSREWEVYITPVEKIRSEMALTTAWAILGLPQTRFDGKDASSPFRDDKTPSFSVYAAKDHLRWYDHATGEGGDVIDLWAKARELSVPAAIAEILHFLKGGGIGGERVASGKEKQPTAAPEAKEFRCPPDMRPPLESECRALSVLRPGILPGAFELAGRLGILKVATVYRELCWILTDASRICAAARRFNGEVFPQIGNKKSFALPGSKKDWPLGLKTERPEFDAIENILVVEGEPDYFAALSLAIDSPINFRPIAMLGAKTPVLRDATRMYIQGKKILIIPHNDVPGQSALPKWVKRFYELGAKSVQSQALPILHDDLAKFLENPEDNNPLDLLKGFSSHVFDSVPQR